MYFDIGKVLAFQRNFNFINGPRSIGKSYTTIKHIIKKCQECHRQFVYIVRTQTEKESGVLERAVEKVVTNEFSDMQFSFTVDTMYLTENEVKTPIAFCIALSEAQKIKKRSYPLVNWLIFDEYMLEQTNGCDIGHYVGGWKEPDLLLSIYHTIDREEDRVVCFLLGNNTSFYNPYHMHKAFSIPAIKPGGIWTSKNVLFYWATASPELKESKARCKFIEMISKTNYAKFATDGKYIEDSNDFIEKRTPYARHLFAIYYMGNTYGVWSDTTVGKVYIDQKYDPSCRTIFALTLKDHTENTLLTRNKSSLLKWLASSYKMGKVRFASPEIKAKIIDGLYLIL